MVLRRALTGTTMGGAGLGQVCAPAGWLSSVKSRALCCCRRSTCLRCAHVLPPATLPQPTGKESAVSAAAASASSSSAAATMTATSVAAAGAPAAPPPPPPQPDQKPAHDVVAGAMARAASQSTIHPLDTMKVRMQAGKAASSSGGGGGASAKLSTQPVTIPRGKAPFERQLLEFRGLYKVRVCLWELQRVAGCCLPHGSCNFK